MESSSTQRLVPHFVAKHPLIVLKISLGTTNVNLMVVKEEVKKRIPIKWWFQQLSMFFSLVGLKQWTTHCRSQLTNLGFGLLIIQNQQFQDIFCGPGVFFRIFWHGGFGSRQQLVLQSEQLTKWCKNNLQMNQTFGAGGDYIFCFRT